MSRRCLGGVSEESRKSLGRAAHVEVDGEVLLLAERLSQEGALLPPRLPVARRLRRRAGRQWWGREAGPTSDPSRKWRLEAEREVVVVDAVELSRLGRVSEDGELACGRGKGAACWAGHPSTRPPLLRLRDPPAQAKPSVAPAKVTASLAQSASSPTTAARSPRRMSQSTQPQCVYPPSRSSNTCP